MARKLIFLSDIPEMMLIIEHPSGVHYHNQVGGVVCAQEELEGVLTPIDISEEVETQIESCPYLQGRQGISIEIADTIDSLLASQPTTRFVRVDRARLEESWEAWIYVLLDSPDYNEQSGYGPYFGEAFGFGAARGVLTWCNSD